MVSAVLSSVWVYESGGVIAEGALEALSMLVSGIARTVRVGSSEQVNIDFRVCLYYAEYRLSSPCLPSFCNSSVLTLLVICSTISPVAACRGLEITDLDLSCRDDKPFRLQRAEDHSL